MANAGFLDQARPPSREEIADAVGDRLPLWDRLAGWLQATYGLTGEPQFFGKETGWVTRYRRGGKALVSLHPYVGGFRALLVIGPSLAGAVGAADVRPETLAAYQAAHPYPEGRWFWIDVTGEDVCTDIERLVALKSPPPKQPPRVRPAAPGA